MKLYDIVNVRANSLYFVQRKFKFGGFVKALLRRNFHIFCQPFFLKNVKYREICPGLHANAKIAILARNRKNRKHRKSVAIFAILTIFAKIAKIANNRKNRKNSQKLEKTRPSNLFRFLRF